MTAKKKEKRTFETNMKELEVLVEKMNSGELSLEESMQLYEQGMALTKQLHQELAAHQKAIEQIDLHTAEISAFEENEYGV